MVCISAHGDKGIVYGSDGVPVLLNRIQHAFDLAPELKGKPKLHVVFACQGSNWQFISDKTTNQQFVMSLPRTNSSTHSKDSISLMATIEEFVSWCKLVNIFIISSRVLIEYYFFTVEDDGTHFIKTLCNALVSEYAADPPKPRTRDLAQLFTSEVIPAVCSWDFSMDPVYIEGEWVVRKVKQIPESRSSLVKSIRFKTYQTNEFIEPAVIYDGEVDDESFVLARDLWPLKNLYHKALGHKKKKGKVLPGHVENCIRCCKSRTSSGTKSYRLGDYQPS